MRCNLIAQALSVTATLIGVVAITTGLTLPASAAFAGGRGPFSQAIYDNCIRQGLPRKLCVFLDPEPSNLSITGIGFDIIYDNSKVRILPENSGFLCQFSLDGDCPPAPFPTNFDLPVEIGSPRIDTVFDLSVTSNRVILNYDLSNNPAPAPEPFNFFAIAFEPLVDPNLISESDFIQDLNSSNQFCTTTIVGVSCGAAPVPEPNSFVVFFTLGFLGLAFKNKKI